MYSLLLFVREPWVFGNRDRVPCGPAHKGTDGTPGSNVDWLSAVRLVGESGAVPDVESGGGIGPRHPQSAADKGGVRTRRGPQGRRGPFGEHVPCTESIQSLRACRAGATGENGG